MNGYGVEITQGIEEYDPVTQVWKEFWRYVRKEEVYTPKEEKYQDYYGLQIKVY